MTLLSQNFCLPYTYNILTSRKSSMHKFDLNLSISNVINEKFNRKNRKNPKYALVV